MMSLHLDAMLRVSAGSEYGIPSHLPELPATIDFLSPAFVHLSVPFPLTGARGFELTGDAHRYSLLVPGAFGRTFITGPVDAPGRSSNPTENLRPTTLIEALRWPKATLTNPVVLPEPASGDELKLKVAPLPGKTEFRIAKMKLDRETGTVSSLVLYDSSGTLVSGTETTYADWAPVKNPAGAGTCFPGTISIFSPGHKNAITLRVRRVQWNIVIPEELFRHVPPSGATVVRAEDIGPH
jgi:hypothetical protein